MANNKIIHYATKTNTGIRYICNQACSITKEKLSFRTAKVTCKNCLRIIFG